MFPARRARARHYAARVATEHLSGQPVRLSVTGHRHLAHQPSIAEAVDVVLDRRLGAGASGEIWSSLAEGADRLVARRVLGRMGGSLVAVLPVDPDDYEDDFETAESRAEFRDLLAAATRTDVLGPDHTGSRESAYERAGHAVVDASDVLIALWDGEPSRGQGGTADIIHYARARDVDVEVVLVERAARAT
jgi:hypothetical protein